ncbi:hypothetical protein I552_3984 [Mycobacterium xenopi 3993]|nr:hypothetical protein I552_3984 [Mycobacterium xenopi 3993]
MRRVVALSAPQDGGGSVRRGRLAAGLSSIARVRHPSASGRPRWRSLIVVAAVVWALLAVALTERCRRSTTARMHIRCLARWITSLWLMSGMPIWSTGRRSRIILSSSRPRCYRSGRPPR